MVQPLVDHADRPLDRDVALPLPDHRAVLDHMPGSDVPVIRQPWDASDPLPFWAWGRFSGSHLWDRTEDPGEGHDLLGDGGPSTRATVAEATPSERLRTALFELEAPADQLARLGLT